MRHVSQGGIEMQKQFAVNFLQRFQHNMPAPQLPPHMAADRVTRYKIQAPNPTVYANQAANAEVVEVQDEHISDSDADDGGRFNIGQFQSQKTKMENEKEQSE